MKKNLLTLIFLIIFVLAGGIFYYIFGGNSNNFFGKDSNLINKEGFTQSISLVNITQKPVQPIQPKSNLEPVNPQNFDLQNNKEIYNQRFNNFIAQKIYSSTFSEIKLTIINKTQNQEPSQKQFWIDLDAIIIAKDKIENQSGQNILQKVFLPTIADSQKTYVKELDYPTINWSVDAVRAILTLDGSYLDGSPTVNIIGKNGEDYFLVEADIPLGEGVLDTFKDDCGAIGEDYSKFDSKCYSLNISNSNLVQEAVTRTLQNLIKVAEVKKTYTNPSSKSVSKSRLSLDHNGSKVI